MQEKKIISLRDSIVSAIGDFLHEEGFASDGITKLGILEIINQISDYREEGNMLFPEILITNNLNFFKTIPNREIIINEVDLSVTEFKKAIKLCAPLAVNSWIIFIEIKEMKIKYGITSAEMSETSLSIYNQTVGDLKISYQGTTIAYIRNIGQKTVELTGLKKSLIVSLTLDEYGKSDLNEIQRLCQHISSRCEAKYRANIKAFFEKVIDDALKTGHGNLIGIIDDDNLNDLKNGLKGKGGIYLIKPIDFEVLINEAEISKNNESAIELKSHASVLKSMLNHDGITIISNKGKVVGYHILIDDYLKKTDNVNGGARSKAFKSMEKCGLFEACFYKSQDGAIKLWVKK